MLPIPFERRVSKQSLKDRINSKSEFEDLLKKVQRSLPVIIKLHEDFIKMTEDPLFDDIQTLTNSFDLDVRSEMNFAILLFSTGKVCKYISLAYYIFLLALLCCCLILDNEGLLKNKQTMLTIFNVLCTSNLPLIIWRGLSQPAV